jgi:hypothetical protein
VNFFLNFLANFLATVFGALLGIPLALWVERRRDAGNAREARRRHNERLKLVLQIVDKTLEANGVAAVKLVQAINAGAVPVDPKFELETWASVRAELAELLDDAQIRADLARHFGRIAVLVDVHRHYLDAMVEFNADAEVTKYQLRGEMATIAESVWRTAARLRRQLTGPGPQSAELPTP